MGNFWKDVVHGLPWGSITAVLAENFSMPGCFVVRVDDETLCSDWVSMRLMSPFFTPQPFVNSAAILRL